MLYVIGSRALPIKKVPLKKIAQDHWRKSIYPFSLILSLFSPSRHHPLQFRLIPISPALPLLPPSSRPHLTKTWSLTLKAPSRPRPLLDPPSRQSTSGKSDLSEMQLQLQQRRPQLLLTATEIGTATATRARKSSTRGTSRSRERSRSRETRSARLGREKSKMERGRGI